MRQLVLLLLLVPLSGCVSLNPGVELMVGGSRLMPTDSVSGELEGKYGGVGRLTFSGAPVPVFKQFRVGLGFTAVGIQGESQDVDVPVSPGLTLNGEQTQDLVLAIPEITFSVRQSVGKLGPFLIMIEPGVAVGGAYGNVSENLRANTFGGGTVVIDNEETEDDFAFAWRPQLEVGLEVGSSDDIRARFGLSAGYQFTDLSLPTTLGDNPEFLMVGIFGALQF